MRTPAFRAGRRFPLAALCLALAVCACETSKDEDPCKETEKAAIEPYFRITWHVTSSLGAPHVGAVEVMSQKHYCDETVKGTFVFSGSTDDAGYYTGPTTQYKLANEKDYVYCQLSANGSVFSHRYYYAEAYAKITTIGLDPYVQDTIECILP